MPIPIRERKNPETGRGKKADGCLRRRLIQIDADVDAGRDQLVVDAALFKKFSQRLHERIPS